MKSVVSHKFTHEDEVFETKCLLEFHIHTVFCARDAKFLVESLAEFLEQAKTLDETFFRASHTHVFPHDVTEFFVDAVYTALAADCEKTIDAFAHVLFCSLKFGEVSREARNGDLVSEVILNRVRKHEVTIGQTLHECRSTEAVCTVVREVTFTDGKETIDGGHQFVVHPDTTHGVVDSREDLHWSFVRRLVGDFFVHIEEVTIASFDFLATEVFDSL